MLSYVEFAIPSPKIFLKESIGRRKTRKIVQWFFLELHVAAGFHPVSPRWSESFKPQWRPWQQCSGRGGQPTGWWRMMYFQHAATQEFAVTFQPRKLIFSVLLLHTLPVNRKINTLAREQKKLHPCTDMHWCSIIVYDSLIGPLNSGSGVIIKFTLCRSGFGLCKYCCGLVWGHLLCCQGAIFGRGLNPRKEECRKRMRLHCRPAESDRVCPISFMSEIRLLFCGEESYLFGFGSDIFWLVASSRSCSPSPELWRSPWSRRTRPFPVLRCLILLSVQTASHWNSDHGHSIDKYIW